MAAVICANCGKLILTEADQFIYQNRPTGPYYSCGCVELKIEEYQKLLQRVEGLQATIESLEKFRPEWAQGYGSASIAAQTMQIALIGIYDKLGVKNQTEAMLKLEEILNGPT